MRTRTSFPRQARGHCHVSCWRITACGPARPLLRWLDDRSRLAPLPLMAATACGHAIFPCRLHRHSSRGKIGCPLPSSASAAGLRLRPRQLRSCPKPSRRSEEPTSELQSLMRISYAVFCLTQHNHPPPHTPPTPPPPPTPS